MGPIILYAIAAAICVALYFFMNTDAYFQMRKKWEAQGTIRTVLAEESKTQYQIIFVNHRGEQRVAATPRYDQTSKYAQGDTVPIVYTDLNIFNRLSINSVRIKDASLVKRENYTALLLLAGVMVIFGVFRVVTMVSGL